jgi:hypothetical protein
MITLFNDKFKDLLFVVIQLAHLNLMEYMFIPKRISWISSVSALLATRHHEATKGTDTVSVQVFTRHQFIYLYFGLYSLDHCEINLQFHLLRLLLQCNNLFSRLREQRNFVCHTDDFCTFFYFLVCSSQLGKDAQEKKLHKIYTNNRRGRK